jgi:hypothetical protein
MVFDELFWHHGDQPIVSFPADEDRAGARSSPEDKGGEYINRVMKECVSSEQIAVDERVDAPRPPGAKGPGYADEAH